MNQWNTTYFQKKNLGASHFNVIKYIYNNTFIATIMFNTYLGFFLIRNQVNWYFKRIIHRIIRFKITFLVFFAVFLQVGVAFNYIFSTPADFLYQNKNSLISKFLFLIFFQLMAVCWIAMQRDALQPPKINAFILTLPIKKLTLKISQLFLLVLANNVILLFYIFPLFFL